MMVENTIPESTQMPNDKSWSSFYETAIKVAELNDFIYCEARPLLNKQLSILGASPSKDMVMGKALHQAMHITDIERLPVAWKDPEKVSFKTLQDVMRISRRNLENALSERIVLSNPNLGEPAFFLSVVPELIEGRGLIGRPDIIDCKTDEMPIIVERKFTKTRLEELRKTRRFHDVLQVSCYILGLKELGFTDTYGLLVLSDPLGREARHRIILTQAIEKKLVEKVTQMDHVLREISEPKPHSIKKCRAGICAKYGKLCKYRLNCL